MAVRNARAREVDLVVVGAGLAGLAAAVTADRAGASTAVLEAAEEPGGFARSFRVDGYTFDCSGHLLHLARPETKSLIYDVTPRDDWQELERRSAVVFGDRLVPYPFQLHLAYAPPEVRDECLRLLPSAPPDLGTDPARVPFADWISASLGDGIGRHFMVPYNEKVAQVPVTELTCEWLGRFVPRPSLDEIREGARERHEGETGYNTRFLYPRAGGIDLMWKGLSRELDSVTTGARVVAVDSKRRTVRTASGAEVSYREGLVSSVPLPDMARSVRPASAALELASLLRASTVTCVNLGLRRLAPELSEVQWLYLPEKRFRGYRVGFYNRFSSEMSPPGREGAYVEIAHAPTTDERTLVAAAIADLTELGAIGGEEDVEVAAPVRLENAYVVHDRRCSWARERIHGELARRRIEMVGRYGRWEYASMEDALWQGIEAGRRILGEAARPAALRATR